MRIELHTLVYLYMELFRTLNHTLEHRSTSTLRMNQTAAHIWLRLVIPRYNVIQQDGSVAAHLEILKQIKSQDSLEKPQGTER